VAAGVTAGFVPATSLAGLAVALGLLGFGWSLGLVAGTTTITNNTPVATRAKTQGAADLFIAIAGTAGALMSGVVVAMANFAILAAAGAVLAAAIIPALLATRHRSA
jgi:hypothetical protein